MRLLENVLFDHNLSIAKACTSRLFIALWAYCLFSGIADLQFVYLHCEIELMNIGFAPTCDDKLFDSALRRNFNAGKLPIFNINPYKG